MNATEWFDQFPSLADGAEWDTEGQWCPRHWAPCPIFRANGIGATVELIHIFINEIKPTNITAPSALNRYMKSVGYVCCTLGDERMYELWGRWGPSEPFEQPCCPGCNSELLCRMQHRCEKGNTW